MTDTLRPWFRALLAAAFLAMLPVPALAQGADRPPVAPPQPFELPETSRFILENGLEVVFIPFGRAPTAQISIQVRSGNIDEQPGKTWLANLTGAMLQTGSAGRTKAELAETMATFGGRIRVSVGMHRTSIGATVLSERATEALTLLAGIVQAPSFPEAEFERVRSTLARTAEAYSARPDSLATQASRRLLFGGHPYGTTLPEPGQVSGYTLEDVRRFYVQTYGAGRTRIYVAGRFDPATMTTAVRDAFSGWAGGEADTARPAPPRPGPIVQLIDRPGATQTTVRLAFPVMAIDAENAPAMTVASALLGGAFTSRLVQRLREERGYAYAPAANISWMLEGGFWTFGADIAAADTAAALRETYSEISRLQQEAPTAEEVDGIRNWLAGTFILRNASAGGLIDQLARRDLHRLPDTYLDDYVPNLLAVNEDDLSRIAQTYLSRDRMVLVLVGDLAAIETDVRALDALQDAQILAPAQRLD